MYTLDSRKLRVQSTYTIAILAYYFSDEHETISFGFIKFSLDKTKWLSIYLSYMYRYSLKPVLCHTMTKSVILHVNFMNSIMSVLQYLDEKWYVY